MRPWLVAEIECGCNGEQRVASWCSRMRANDIQAMEGALRCCVTAAIASISDGRGKAASARVKSMKLVFQDEQPEGCCLADAE